MISAGARVGSAGGTPAFQHRIEEGRRLVNRKRDGGYPHQFHADAV